MFKIFTLPQCKASHLVLKSNFYTCQSEKHMCTPPSLGKYDSVNCLQDWLAGLYKARG